MNDEKANEVTTLKTAQESLVVLTFQTMKSNLTETINKLDELENKNKLSNKRIREIHNELMKKNERLNNLIAALETIYEFINKGSIPIPKRDTRQDNVS